MIPGETVLSQRALGWPVDPHVSEFKVMYSQGMQLYYIGTTHVACGECTECKESDLSKGYEQPNSRETDYMSKEDAARSLEVYKEDGILLKARTP